MKIPKLPVRKKVRASTARRSMGPSDEMDYEEMSEPNMKLSRALLVVLVLHVVAVAGIIAFNTIKSRQGTFPASTSTSPSASASPAQSNPAAAPPNDATAAAPALAANQAPLPRREEANAAPPKPAGKEEPVKAAKALPVESDSGKIYIVAKGDNPVNIARKLKVSQAELLAVNNITDPTKLQIGQKLIVPTKTIASSKSSSPSKTTTTAKASKTKKSDD